MTIAYLHCEGHVSCRGRVLSSSSSSMRYNVMSIIGQRSISAEPERAGRSTGFSAALMNGFGMLLEVCAPVDRSPISGRTASPIYALAGDFQRIGSDMERAIRRERRAWRDDARD
ncbi:hypothetical protein [Jiella sp. M17.18]|uniref:hypothetical protein n=1 Tax=Jiella sp. M17.18 TaxID=3234247 RepID=UPI0034DE4B29